MSKFGSRHRLEFRAEPTAPLAHCIDCPLKDRPSVAGRGPGKASLVIVGEAPGDEEVKLDTPFVGPAGIILREVLEALQMGDSSVHITNTVLCHPGRSEKTNKYKAPPTGAIQACRERLLREIQLTQAKRVLATGATAARGLTGERMAVGESRCSLVGPLPHHFLGDDVLVGVTYHPKARVADVRTLLSSDIRCLRAL